MIFVAQFGSLEPKTAPLLMDFFDDGLLEGGFIGTDVGTLNGVMVSFLEGFEVGNTVGILLGFGVRMREGFDDNLTGV